MRKIIAGLSCLWIIMSCIYIYELVISPFSTSALIERYANSMIVVLIGCVISSFIIDFLTMDEED